MHFKRTSGIGYVACFLPRSIPEKASAGTSSLMEKLVKLKLSSSVTLCPKYVDGETCNFGQTGEGQVMTQSTQNVDDEMLEGTSTKLRTLRDAARDRAGLKKRLVTVATG